MPKKNQLPIIPFADAARNVHIAQERISGFFISLPQLISSLKEANNGKNQKLTAEILEMLENNFEMVKPYLYGDESTAT